MEGAGAKANDDNELDEPSIEIVDAADGSDAELCDSKETSGGSVLRHRSPATEPMWTSRPGGASSGAGITEARPAWKPPEEEKMEHVDEDEGRSSPLEGASSSAGIEAVQPAWKPNATRTNKIMEECKEKDRNSSRRKDKQ